MDQFRGYTVAGMCLVNFLGGYAAIHPVFMHNNNYYSYADTIMPSFMFACGFSYRLTVLKRSRRPRGGHLPAVHRAQPRPGAGLADDVRIRLEVPLFGELSPEKVHLFLVKLIKADLWEVLAIIGVGQLLIMPVIAASGRVRALTIAAFLLLHLVLTHLFNFDFVFGRPNMLDRAARVGGFLGVGRRGLRPASLVGNDAGGLARVRLARQPDARASVVEARRVGPLPDGGGLCAFVLLDAV